MKGIAIGESNFKNLITSNDYYIDKTMYIKHILDNSSRVILVTRPRRFGKTLNMSMLKYYFDCTEEKDNSELFKGLKIMEQGEEYISKLGAYPCIYVSLKDIEGQNYDKMLATMRTTIAELYTEHRYLLESNKIYPEEKQKITDILYGRASEEVVKSSIKELSKYLNRQFEKKVMLLIDEYDVPLQHSYVKGYYEEAIEFFKTFFRLTFKDNPYMEKTVLTGVSRVAKESIFSGANNFKVFTVLDNEFSEDFGITSEEIEKVLKDFELEENKEEVKKWYDGYKIGDTEGIYNPWSILNYLTDKKLIPYWVNTSSNDLIKLILKNSTTVKQKMEMLLNDEVIEEKIEQETIITGIEQNEDNIWGLLVETGHLKVEEDVNVMEEIYKVKIPNFEIKHLFPSIIRDWLRNKVIENDSNNILKKLVTLNLE